VIVGHVRARTPSDPYVTAQLVLSYVTLDFFDLKWSAPGYSMRVTPPSMTRVWPVM